MNKDNICKRSRRERGCGVWGKKKIQEVLRNAALYRVISQT